MPVEAKPLFRPDVLRPRVAAFPLPRPFSEMTSRLRQWADTLRPPAGDRLTEKEQLPRFLIDVFGDVLGYADRVGSPARWTFSTEKHVEVDRKFADGVLGEFRPKADRFVVAIEGKGPKDPLDRPFAGRKKSAVDQCYGYAINLKCDWVIVTSMRETRLYHKGSDQHTYERFRIDDLANDELALRKFVFLLGAARVVPEGGACHFAELLAASEQVGRELTAAFYKRYAEMRKRAFAALCQANGNVAREAVLRATQKLLDRVLFCCFAEDRNLLPAETIRKAFEHADPYRPAPVYENFRGLFRAMDQGSQPLGIPAYNGGLFAIDPVLDALAVPDDVCRSFKELADYDYRPGHVVGDDAKEGHGRFVDVELLGHIFEQSITDLERLHDELAGGAKPQTRGEGVSRRKREGAYYTPAFITRYLVGQTLGQVLADRYKALRVRHQANAERSAIKALDDPAAYDPADLNKPQRLALTGFWLAWQGELRTVRVLDPACGSGAFLIEAFDQLHAEYLRCNDRLKELQQGQASLFDLDREILQNNLFGVDVNDEAIQIARLSLWIKTAERDKQLTSLDKNLRIGNSVIGDPTVESRAFDWKETFPEVFDSGGFDVVVGNPPYVRQEMLSPLKPYLKENYRSYHGTADLYVYFYELGLRVLRPGGRLGFVVTNKWLKAGYGEPLRRFLAEESRVESVVDFGHAKQIFPDADVFPGLLVTRRPAEAEALSPCRVCVVPREQLRVEDLGRQIHETGFEVPADRLGAAAWSLEPPAVEALLAKLRRVGVPLRDFANARPLLGIKTGLNEAFLVDTPTKDALVAADAKSADLLRPYVRGQDVDRWRPAWAGMWMLAIKSSGEHPWPWADAGDEAEAVFARTYPAVHQYLNQHREALICRQDQGKFWWELRACAYWKRFEARRILYQEIQSHPCFSLADAGLLGNNKTFFLPTDDLYLLGVLNSPLLWWFNWRHLPHMKDEALTPLAVKMEEVPVARPTPEVRQVVEETVSRLLECVDRSRSGLAMLLDWLRVGADVEKPSQKLLDPAGLTSDDFVAEVRRLRSRSRPLTPALLQELRATYAACVEPLQALAGEALGLERRLSDAVNAAFQLTPDEVALMWRTAPPRMPFSGP